MSRVVLSGRRLWPSIEWEGDHESRGLEPDQEVTGSAAVQLGQHFEKPSPKAKIVNEDGAGCFEVGRRSTRHRLDTGWRKIRVTLVALDEVQSLGDLTRPFAAPSRAKCDKLAFGSFLLANSCLMAYGQGVMSLTETISSAYFCPGRKRLSEPDGRVSRRSTKRHCTAHAVPDPYATRETKRSAQGRSVCTAWGVGHPDEP